MKLKKFFIIMFFSLFLIGCTMVEDMSYQDIIRNSTAQIQVSSSKGNGYYNTSPSYDVRTKYREKLYYNNPFNKDGINVLLAIKTQ